MPVDRIAVSRLATQVNSSRRPTPQSLSIALSPTVLSNLRAARDNGVIVIASLTPGGHAAIQLRRTLRLQR